MNEKELKKIQNRYERNCWLACDESKSEESRKKHIRYASCLAERLGLVKRPKGCQWCFKKKYLYRHHWNYQDPLDISFLCYECHPLADEMKTQMDNIDS
jgi:hypothetical protein